MALIKNTEKPMLFNVNMVSAILAERKNQTRRILKSKSPEMTALMMNILCGVNVESCKEELLRFAPISVGDTIWVRENWMFWGANLEFGECTFKFQTGDLHTWDIDEYKGQGEWVQEQFNILEAKGVFKLSDDKDLAEDELYYNRTDVKQSWKPSIHMPKEAARIFLTVNSVSIDLLQDISESDAINEGIERLPLEHWWRNYLNDPLPGCSMGKESFKTLWQSINGVESWELNPLVWVIKFDING